MNPNHPQADIATHHQENDADAEARGGDHRPSHTLDYGMKQVPPIRDQFATYAPTNADFSKGTVNEFGFEPGDKEVSRKNGSVHAYGFDDHEKGK